jgi:hypothetical protein
MRIEIEVTERKPGAGVSALGTEARHRQGRT